MSVDNVNGANSEQADPVELLVGDGKKYKTIQDLAKSRLEADAFIDQLKTENQSLREIAKASERKSRTEDFESFLAELRGTEKPETTAKPTTGDNQATKGLDLETVEKYIEARENRKRMDASLAAVKQELSKTYGDKTDEVYNKALTQHGLSDDIVKALAFKSPQAALGALGFTSAKPAGQGTMQPSVDTGAFFGSKPESRNWDYYKALKTKMTETEFYDRKIQQQLFKDRMALGDDFWK